MKSVHASLPEGRLLRSLRADDGEALFAAASRNQSHLVPWLSWAREVQRDGIEAYVESVLRLFADGESLPGVIVEGDHIVGSCGFHRIDRANDWAAIGYWLDASLEGRGIVTAAVRALIDHGFGELGLHRVEIGAAPDNTGSCAVAQRLGFTREGTRREAERHHDRYGDIVLYSVLRPEWEKLLRQ